MNLYHHIFLYFEEEMKGEKKKKKRNVIKFYKGHIKSIERNLFPSIECNWVFLVFFPHGESTKYRIWVNFKSFFKVFQEKMRTKVK